MFIPVAHESDTVRRIPWISIVIIVLCVLVHIFISRDVKKTEKELKNGYIELLGYYLRHPYLHLDPEAIKVFSIDENGLAEVLTVYKRFYRIPEDETILTQEQDNLNQMVRRLIDSSLKIPYRKWGFIPTNKTLRGLLAHMFIHGGWFHLLGNLLLLYLTGPFIEDVWGRPIFITFYLLMGIISALMFAVHHPDFSGPLIGASGAISGLMGAFLIRYWRTRIKFIFIIFPLIGRSFKAPAWIILPLWFVLELQSARIMDSINPGGGGVAHWAHIWGFIFGAAIALGMKYFQIEEKYINPKIEQLTTFVDKRYQTYEKASELIEAGNKKEAFDMLLEGAKNDPSHSDIVPALWKLSLETGKTAEVAKYLPPLIENEIKLNRFDSALYYYRQLNDNIPAVSVSTQVKMRLGEYLLFLEELQEARGIIREILGKVNNQSPPGFLVDFFSLSSQVDYQTAEKVVSIILKHPNIPTEKKCEIKSRLDQISKNAPVIHTGAEIEHSRIDFNGAVENGKSTQRVENKMDDSKILKITRAVPLGIKDNHIYLKLEKIGQKVLSLENVKMIYVVKISPKSDPAFLLIDLLLDELGVDHKKIRIIRLHSSQFDARKFVPKARNQLDAFKILVMALEKLSKAKPYPSSESLRLNKVPVFSGIQEYENYLQKKIVIK